jgi:hypothetical protein
VGAIKSAVDAEGGNRAEQSARGDMMKVGPILVFAALAALPRPAVAQNGQGDSALEVQSWCRPYATVEVLPNGLLNAPQGSEAQFCWGAFAAIQELSVTTYGTGGTMLHTCPPPDSTRLQFIKIFLGYVDEHPERANLPFANVAVAALERAFPCRSN